MPSPNQASKHQLFRQNASCFPRTFIPNFLFMQRNILFGGDDDGPRPFAVLTSAKMCPSVCPSVMRDRPREFVKIFVLIVQRRIFSSGAMKYDIHKTRKRREGLRELFEIGEYSKGPLDRK